MGTHPKASPAYALHMWSLTNPPSPDNTTVRPIKTLFTGKLIDAWRWLVNAHARASILRDKLHMRERAVETKPLIAQEIGVSEKS